MMIEEGSLKEHLETVTKLRDLLNEIEILGKRLTDTLKRGNKVLLMGNGGSAADCQHIAAELVGRFKKERKKRITSYSFNYRHIYFNSSRK